MSVPKAVVFDLGKVLLDFDYGIAAAKIARQSKLAPPLVLQVLIESPLLGRLETGLLSDHDFAVEVGAACGFAGAMDEFYGAFADIFSEIQPMIELHRALRANRIPTCIFSNTNGLAIGHIRGHFPFFAHFDHYILSYQVGVMKPGGAIYAAVERATGLTGEALVYLDDRPENVEGGLRRGWRALLHETPEKTIAALSKLGLPTSPSF